MKIIRLNLFVIVLSLFHGVLFAVMKLTNYIDYSWWYITLPMLWSTCLFYFGVFLAYLYFEITKER
jgi:hypothetical protein